ncbi:MAG: glycosyltransferase family 39 protein [Pyrinomonadaceae bacterium]
MESDELYTIPASLGRHYRFQSKFRQPDCPISIAAYSDLLTPDAGGNSLGDVTDVLRRNVHAPLYFYFMHYWIGLFGTSESSLRAPSAVWGVLSIFLIFLLGRELFDGYVGLFAALLLALLPEQIYHATCARMYSLLVLLAVASTYLLVLALKRPSAKALYIAYGAVSVAGLYTHYIYLFCFMFQVAYTWSQAGRRKERIVPWLVTQLCVACAFAPWMLVSVAQKQTAAEALLWVSGGLSFREIIQALFQQIALLTSVPDVPFGAAGQWAAVILLLVGLGALLPERRKLLLLGLWVVVPVGGVLAADIFKGTRAVTVTRYWLVVSPALYLLIGVGARQIAEPYLRVGLAAVLALLLGAAGVSTAVGQLRPKHDDYRQLTHYLESRITETTDEVVLAEGDAAIPLALAYYGDRDIQIWRLNLLLNEPRADELSAGLQKLRDEQRAIWLLSYYSGEAAELLESAGFQPDGVGESFGFIGVRRYVAGERRPAP